MSELKPIREELVEEANQLCHASVYLGRRIDKLKEEYEEMQVQIRGVYEKMTPEEHRVFRDRYEHV